MFKRVLVLLMALFCAASPSYAQTPDPVTRPDVVAESVVRGFYDWYLFAKVPHSEAEPSTMKAAAQYFDPKLFALILKCCPGNELDWDVFADSNAEVPKGYTVGKPSYKGSSVLVPIALHYPHLTDKHVTAIVSADSSGRYRIDDLVYGDGGPPPHELSAILRLLLRDSGVKP